MIILLSFFQIFLQDDGIIFFLFSASSCSLQRILKEEKSFDSWKSSRSWSLGAMSFSQSSIRPSSLEIPL